jgi:hypothetical protein
MKQANFLYLLDGEGETIPGRVFQVSRDKWQAMIMGGWWVGFGRTRAAAIKNAKKAYRNEQERQVLR